MQAGTEQPFWRSEPLSDGERALWQAVERAHSACVWRDNTSSVAVLQAATGSGDYTKAVAAALMTLGGRHAPIEQSMGILVMADSVKAAHSFLAAGLKVPGWGNSFIKGGPDKSWDEVDKLLAKHFERIHSKIVAVTTYLHERGKKVFPNPSIYTAALALILKVPAPMAPWLFVRARLDAWTELICRSSYGGKA